MTRVASLAALATLLSAAAARADGVNEHDGFYLRLGLGGGYTSMSADDATSFCATS